MEIINSQCVVQVTSTFNNNYFKLHHCKFVSMYYAYSDYFCLTMNVCISL